LSFLVGFAIALVADGQNVKATRVHTAASFDRAARSARVNPAAGLEQDTSKVPNAPPVYITEMRDAADCGKCDYSYRTSGSIDLHAVQSAVTERLKRGGVDVSFAGYAAGELLLNSASTSPSILSYYQIRVIAANYDPEAKTFEDHLYIDASLISVDGGKVTAQETGVTSSMERLILSKAHLVRTGE
jgi:hypothetical protein